MVLLAKSKLNSIDVVFSKALIYSNIIHGGFVLINNVLKEYDDIKKEIRKLKDFNSLLKILLYSWNVIILFEV